MGLCISKENIEASIANYTPIENNVSLQPKRHTGHTRRIKRTRSKIIFDALGVSISNSRNSNKI